MGGGFPTSPWVVSRRTSDFVADETFVVSNVFCPLDQGEVDSVDIHGVWVMLCPLWAGGGRDITCSSTEFAHTYGCVIELTSLPKPVFVGLQFFK